MNKNELKNLLDFVKENENRKIFGIFENTVYYLPEQEDLYILPKDTIIDNGFHLKEIRCMLDEYINDNYNFTKKILSDNSLILLKSSSISSKDGVIIPSNMSDKYFK